MEKIITKDSKGNIIEIDKSEYEEFIKFKESKLVNYQYRNYPMTKSKNNWYVGGVSITEFSKNTGILEWCIDENDAKMMLEQMKKYSQFSNLEISNNLKC